jgi:ZIP family zinc transporter
LSTIQFFSGMVFFAVLSKIIPEDIGGHDHGHEEKKAEKKSGSPKSPKRVGTKSPSTRRTRSSRRDAVEDGEEVTEAQTQEKHKEKEEKELKRVGLVTALGISIHNFPEGIAVYLACMKGMDVGLPIALAIGAHNIPEGMAVASPIFHSTGSKWEAFKFSMLSGVCEPVAALLFALFFSSYMTDEVVQILLAAVAGIMVLVSLKELLPTSLKYISANSAMISNALGMIFIALSIYYLHQSGGHDHSHGGHHHHDHAHSADPSSPVSVPVSASASASPSPVHVHDHGHHHHHHDHDHHHHHDHHH